MKSIAVFLPECPWGDVDQNALGRGLGGRETALVELCCSWVKMGIDVYAFVPRSQVVFARDPESGAKLKWIPNERVIEVTEVVQPDLFISWENVEVLKVLRERGYRKTTAIEMQVAHLESDVPLRGVADYACLLSEWAEEFFLTQHPDMAGYTVVLPNGVRMDRFPKEIAWGKTHAIDADVPFNFIYSSSPDRGLHHLLRMWPEIRAAAKLHHGRDSTLHVCYGVENFINMSRWSHREDGLRALAIEELIGQEGVVYHGKIGQHDLAQLMIDSDLMLYPCDTMSPTETGCISIVEALAAGTPVVTTNCDCIGPDYHAVTAQVDLPLDDREYIDAVVERLDPEDYASWQAVGRQFVERHRQWDHIAARWIEFFEKAWQEEEAAEEACLIDDGGEAA